MAHPLQLPPPPHDQNPSRQPMQRTRGVLCLVIQGLCVYTFQKVYRVMHGRTSSLCTLQYVCMYFAKVTIFSSFHYLLTGSWLTYATYCFWTWTPCLSFRGTLSAAPRSPLLLIIGGSHANRLAWMAALSDPAMLGITRPGWRAGKTAVESVVDELEETRSWSIRFYGIASRSLRLWQISQSWYLRQSQGVPNQVLL